MNSNRLDCRPRIDPAAWVAKTAIVLGDVSVGPRSSIWFGAIIRGDTERISVGAETNVQDLALLHADPDLPCQLGNRVTVGHSAIVHGATVEDNVLIGMRSTILNGAVIGAGSVVGAGALVREGQVVPPRSLVVGIPARRIREIDAADLARLEHAWKHYVQLSADYKSRGY